MSKNDVFAQRMVGFALDRGWRPNEEDLAPFMERLVESLENGRTDTARRCADITAIVHGCGVAYNRILREFGLAIPEES